MSDSMRSPMPPVVPGFANFKFQERDMFNGEPSGKYLANRLQAAYEAGWRDCEATIKRALEGR